MKTKSLLLGSAAALVAVSGARAADAVIIPEPEMVEYVRVCDAAGTGYFYIPGTEICLRVGGYIRYDMGFGDTNEVISGKGEGTWNKRARFSFRTWTYADTDWGALRTYTETRFQNDTNNYANTAGGFGYTNDNEFDLANAWIDLNGFRVGVANSNFTTFTGYGGAVINDTTGGGYGPFQTNFMSYTYSGGPFTAMLALEEGNDNYNLTGIGSPIAGWGIDDYMPHVVAGLGYDAGIVNLRGVFGYDTRDDFAGFTYGGWAAKIRADADITSNISAFLMVLYGENSSGYTTWANGTATDETWSVMGGATIGLTDTLDFNTQVQWAEANGGSSDEWSVVGNLAYEVAPSFTVTPEVQWHRTTTSDNEWGGTIRFERSF